MQNLRIDPQRLWDSSWRRRSSARTPKGGIKRLTVTDDDKRVRDWFKAQCEALGCTVTVDEVGNMFARRPGRNDALLPIAMGSHLDTQPTGGKFDGVLGRARRAGGAAHAGDGRLRDQRADRDRQLDQRGGLALRAGDAVLGRVRRRVHAGLCRLRREDRDGKRFGDELDAHRLSRLRAGRAATSWAPCSSCTSSRGRSWRPRKR